MISFKKYYRLLNETFVNMFRTNRGIMELNINEPLQRLERNQRGIILSNGSLITGKAIHDDFTVVHYDIQKAIITIPNMISNNNGEYGMLNVQRLENSNRFYLGESYSPEHILKLNEDPAIESLLSSCNRLNPEKVFMLESIRNVRQGRTIHEI
jgi:hypothetical protein